MSTYAFITKLGTARYFRANATGDIQEVREDETEYVYTGSFTSNRLLDVPGSSERV